MLDGDAMWNSDKIRALPPWAKAEFSWLLPLAMANGVFECEPRKIWVSCYAYGRPEMTLDQVIELLHAFEKVGLIFRWREDDGKEWAYWVGIEKEGRLPPLSRIKRKESQIGPQPPQNKLLEFIRTYCVRNTSLGWVGLGWVGNSIFNTSSQEQKILPIQTSAAPSEPVVPVTVWLNFVEHRKKLHKPLTDHAGELIRRKLEDLKSKGHDPVELLETAIERGWLTVYEPEPMKGTNGHGKSGKLTGEELTRANLRAAGFSNTH